MSTVDLIKLFVISEIIWIVALFIAMLINRLQFSIPRLLVIATVPAFVFLLPLGFMLNLIAATIVMYTLIVKLTNAKIFPDAFLTVMVANIVYVVLGVWMVARFS